MKSETPRPILREDLDAQRLLALKQPPRNKRFDKARAILAEDAPVHERAEALATLGRFDEAAALGTAQAEFYKKIWGAVWADDEDRCDCPQITVRTRVAKDPTNEQGGLDVKDITVRHTFVVRTVYSLKHGQEFPLVACNACGYLNVYDFR